MEATKRVAIYTRVSTKGQNVEGQLSALREVCIRNEWTVVAEYCDHGFSGSLSREERPALAEMMRDAMRRKFDRICVWSVDRLGRSLRDLVSTLHDLGERRIQLYAHMQGLDTSTTTGTMMWQFLGIFAEFERDMIRERVRNGLARARSRGKKLGRPPLSAESELRIAELRKTGLGMVAIGRKLGVGTSQVQRVCRQIDGGPRP